MIFKNVIIHALSLCMFLICAVSDARAGVANQQILNCSPFSRGCGSFKTDTECADKPCCQWIEEKLSWRSTKKECVHKCSQKNNQADCESLKTKEIGKNICVWENNTCAVKSEAAYREELKAYTDEQTAARIARMKILYDVEIKKGILPDNSLILEDERLETADCKNKNTIGNCNKELMCIYHDNKCVPNVCGTFNEFNNNNNRCDKKPGCMVKYIRVKDNMGYEGEEDWFPHHNGKCIPNSFAPGNVVDD